MDRRKEEQAIIDELHREGRRLLNDFKGYDYRVAREDDEREKIQRYIDLLIDDSMKRAKAVSN
jgi:hypothetical protein